MKKDFTGDFETHLTVRLGGGHGNAHEEALIRWAERHRAKYTRIVLDRGETPDQPMLTTSGKETLAKQRNAAAQQVAQLHTAGFNVVRVKIEASPWKCA